MNTLVVDASVTVKWMLGPSADEADFIQARNLMQSIANGSIAALQPVHWYAEVAAVLTRVQPETASRSLGLLWNMDLPVANEWHLVKRACDLAQETGQHLFDTLYHAVALETPGALLITADECYARQAGRYGSVQLLREFA